MLIVETIIQLWRVWRQSSQSQSKGDFCFSAVTCFSLSLFFLSATIVCRSSIARCSKDGPWGICVELNLKARLLSFCLFVLQMGGGGDKMLQRLQGSAWLSSRVQQNPFFCICAEASSTPITASLMPAMPWFNWLCLTKVNPAAV